MKNLIAILMVLATLGASAALFTGPSSSVTSTTISAAGGITNNESGRNLPALTVTNGVFSLPVFYGGWTNPPGQSNTFLRVTNFGTAGNQDLKQLIFDGDGTNRYHILFGTTGPYQTIEMNGQHSGGPELQWTGDAIALTPGYWSQAGAYKSNRRLQIGSGENHRGLVDLFSDELADATATLGYSLPLRFRASWYSNAVFDVYPTLWAKADRTNGWSLNIYSNFLDTVTSDLWTSSNQTPQVKINFGPAATAGVDMHGIVNVWGPGYLNVSNSMILGNAAAASVVFLASTSPDLLQFGSSGGTECDIAQRDTAGRYYFKSGQNGNVFEKNGLWVNALRVTNVISPIIQATNAIGDWPANALTNGGWAVVNSNGTPLVLQSGPDTTTWSSTNNLVHVGNYAHMTVTSPQALSLGTGTVNHTVTNYNYSITSGGFGINTAAGIITNQSANGDLFVGASVGILDSDELYEVGIYTNDVLHICTNSVSWPATAAFVQTVTIPERVIPNAAAGMTIRLKIQGADGTAVAYDLVNADLYVRQRR